MEPLRHFPYPVTIRILNGYYEVSSPDFGIIKADRRVDEMNSAEQMGMLVFEVMRRSIRLRDERISKNEPLPTPSKPRGVLETPEIAHETLLTMREVQAMLQVSDETVRRLCKRGTLIPILTQGRHRRFRMKDIQNYLGKSAKP